MRLRPFIMVLVLSFAGPARASGLAACRRADALFHSHANDRAFRALNLALTQRLSAADRPDAALLTRLVRANGRYAASLAAAGKRRAALRASAAGLSVSRWVLHRAALRLADVRVGTALWSEAAQGLEAMWRASRQNVRAQQVAAQRAGMDRFTARVLLPRCRAAARFNACSATLEASALVRAWEREMVRTAGN